MACLTSLIRDYFLLKLKAPCGGRKREEWKDLKPLQEELF